LAVAAIVVAAGVLIAALLVFPGLDPLAPRAIPGPPPGAPVANVTVQQFEIDPGNCFGGSTAPGGSIVAGGTLSASSILMNDDQSGTCEVTGVSSGTNGFTVTGSNAPLIVRPNSVTTLTVSVKTPETGVDEPVTLNVAVVVLG
jgi:hypothetical protein